MPGNSEIISISASAPRLNLTLAVSSFYALQAIEASPKLYQSDVFFLRSHEVFTEAFVNYKQEFEAKLARAMFDYLALAAFGEARHSTWNAIRKTVIAHEDSNIVRPRNEIYVEGTNHDPKKFLPFLVKLFRDQQAFKSGFSVGGEPWAKIAEAALLYYKFPPSVFIDHAVDLSHHGGLCFDKPMLLYLYNNDTDYYKTLLDRHQNAMPMYSHGPLDDKTAELVQRAIHLGFCQFTRENLFMGGSHELHFPEPIKWGHKSIYKRIRKAVKREEEKKAA